MKIGDKTHEKGDEIQRENGRVVLAHGEVTGHAHAIKAPGAKLYAPAGVDPNDTDAVLMGTRILSTVRGVDLTHEEHSTIPVPKGEWGVRVQRQYDEGMARRVED